METRTMTSRFLLVWPVHWSAMLLVFATIGSFAAQCHGDDVAEKYVGAARALLASPDETTRGLALSVVLSNEPSDGVKLRPKPLKIPQCMSVVVPCNGW